MLCVVLCNVLCLLCVAKGEEAGRRSGGKQEKQEPRTQDVRKKQQKSTRVSQTSPKSFKNKGKEKGAKDKKMLN